MKKLFIYIFSILSIILINTNRIALADDNTSLANVNAQNEISCLARAIYFESKGGLERDMKDVGHVVLNRANSPKFPSDVCSVVYQRTPRVCQFSWVCTPHRVKEYREYNKSMEYAQELLRQEKVGNRRDTTNGALFFRVTNKRTTACHVNNQHAFFK
jgi:spore germination cell wall hydrolase CwlJ-like protein